MKKIFVALALLLSVGITKTFAGYLNIINMTPCTLSITGGLGRITDPNTGNIYGFNFGPVTLPPGSTNFANVSLLPGFTTSAPTAVQNLGCVYHVRMQGPGPIDFFIGVAQSSFTVTNSPACNGGNSYMATWNLSGNGCDAVILIF